MHFEVRNVVVSSIIVLLVFLILKTLQIKNNFLLTTILVLVLLHVNLSQPACGQHMCNGAFLNDDGFGYYKNYFPEDVFKLLQSEYVNKNTPKGKMYPNNTTFLGNPKRGGYIDTNTEKIIEYIRNRLSESYGQTLYVDYAFLRYYNGSSLNPFENFHYDSSHYDSDVVQIRSLFNIYDKSDGTFTYESECCNNGTKTFYTEENTLALIQANKLRHKYNYIKGERLVLVVDLVSSYKRGIYGNVWGTWDYIWDRIQKSLTSF